MVVSVPRSAIFNNDNNNLMNFYTWSRGRIRNQSPEPTENRPDPRNTAVQMDSPEYYK